MPPQMANSFIEQRKFSNQKFGYSAYPQINHSWQFQDQNLHLKDFLTSSSGLLERKKNRQQQSKDIFIRSKTMKAKNINFYPNSKPTNEKGNKLRRTYFKPQSAKRPILNSKSLKSYDKQFNSVGTTRIISRNIPMDIEAQISNFNKNSK